MSSTAMSERDFHSVADEALEEIHDAVEEALEDGFPGDFDCNMSVGATQTSTCVLRLMALHGIGRLRVQSHVHDEASSRFPERG